jgi:hypothetical protein
VKKLKMGIDFNYRFLPILLLLPSALFCACCQALQIFLKLSPLSSSRVLTTAVRRIALNFGGDGDGVRRR